MKSFISKSIIAGLMCVALGSCASGQFDRTKALQAGTTLLQGMTLSDAQVASLCSQYVAQSDAENQVAPSNNAYAKRLANLTKNITQVGNFPANFKVYLTKDVNAFACGDGSVRVYSGLMDLMNDAELMAVVGHEIGHVVNSDSRKAMQDSYRRAAATTALGAISPTAGALAEGALGQIANAYASAQYSQKQEYAADDYGYNFTTKLGYPKESMANSLKKLLSLEGSNGISTSAVQSLFSDHPTTQKRLERLAAKK